jgi:DASH complex subunit SPC19
MSFQSSTKSSLAGALSSLRNSTYTLSSTLSILDAGITDLPRLTHVLSQTRHFELLPLSTLQTAQADVVAELAPELERLISRVEGYVERLEARERGLRARAELQAARLGDSAVRGPTAMQSRSMRESNSNVGTSGSSAAVGAREELKARQLRQKKERLSYAVERLQLQAQQTERKLRKSMAAQEIRRLPVEENDEDELA